MGYSGRIVVARSAGPLAELAALRGVPTLDETVHEGGWRAAQLDGDPGAGALRALVAETGVPALWAYVLDSDAADVEALTPSGLSWHAYLHEDTALSYGAPPLPQPIDEVISQAQAWSAEGGLTASATTLSEAFTAEGVFVEDTMDELLNALGIH